MQVACRSLGYSAGAEIITGISAPFLRGYLPSLVVRGSIECVGNETDLSKCTVSDRSEGGFGDDTAVSLLCTTPSGVPLLGPLKHSQAARYGQSVHPWLCGWQQTIGMWWLDGRLVIARCNTEHVLSISQSQ